MANKKEEEEGKKGMNDVQSLSNFNGMLVCLSATSACGRCELGQGRHAR